MITDNDTLAQSSNPVDTSIVAGNERFQRGMSSLGFLTIVSTVLFFLLCSFKLIPVYIQNWTVSSSLDDIHQEIEAQEKPIVKSAIKTALLKRFSVNQLDSVIPESIEFEKIKNGYVVTVNYEIRLSLVGNIDAVMKFDQNQVEISYP